MITLKRGNATKQVSQRTFDLLGDGYDGWKKQEVDKKPTQEYNKQPLDQPTRQEMFNHLKQKGINLHPNTGDAKLKERYEVEIETDRNS